MISTQRSAVNGRSRPIRPGYDRDVTWAEPPKWVKRQSQAVPRMSRVYSIRSNKRGRAVRVPGSGSGSIHETAEQATAGRDRVGTARPWYGLLFGRRADWPITQRECRYRRMDVRCDRSCRETARRGTRGCERRSDGRASHSLSPVCSTSLNSVRRPTRSPFPRRGRAGGLRNVGEGE